MLHTQLLVYEEELQLESMYIVLYQCIIFGRHGRKPLKASQSLFDSGWLSMSEKNRGFRLLVLDLVTMG